MFSLIKKDFLTTLKIKSIKNLVLIFLFIAICLIFTPLSITAAIFLPLLLSYMIVFNSFYYDNMDDSEKFILSIPVKREDIVYSKYIYSLIILGGSIIITYLLFGGVIFDTVVNFITFRYIAFAIATFLVGSSMVFPFIFKYGYNKVRNIGFLVYILIGFVINSLFNIINLKIEHVKMYGTFPMDYDSGKVILDKIVNLINLNYVNYSSVGILTLFIFIISLYISLRIYSNRDVGRR